MSCCYGRRYAELVRVPGEATPSLQDQTKAAMSMAEKVGLAAAVGSLLWQIITHKPVEPRRRRKGTRRKNR